MHGSAACQHHRDSTYTVPYVSACPICASARPLIRRGDESHDGDLALPFALARDHENSAALPDGASRPMRGIPSQRSVGPWPQPCAVPPRKPIGFRQRTETRMRPKAAHEFPRMKSQSPLLYSCLGVRCKVHEKPHLALCQPQVVQ